MSFCGPRFVATGVVLFFGVDHVVAVVVACGFEVAFGFVFPVVVVPGLWVPPDAVADFSADDSGPCVSVEEVAGLVASWAGLEVHGGDDVVSGVARAGEVEAFVLGVGLPGAWLGGFGGHDYSPWGF